MLPDQDRISQSQYELAELADQLPHSNLLLKNARFYFFETKNSRKKMDYGKRKNKEA